MYTAQQIRDYITQNGLTGNPVEIRKAQQKYGVSDAALNEAIGWERQTYQDPQTGLTSETFTVPSKWEGMPAPMPVAAPNYMQPGASPVGAPSGGMTLAPNPPGGYSADQIRQYINSQGIGNDPQAIYRAAQQYGVGAGQIDSAMGYAPGTSAGWVQQQGLAALPWAPAGGGGMTLAPNPPGGYNTSQAAQPNNPYMGAPASPYTGSAQPANPYMGGQRPQPMQQPMQPQQRPGLDNPYTSWMADDITRRASTQFMQQINPAINRAAVANGGYGGSRQGIAQGLAMSQGMDNIAGKLSGLYANQFNADRNYGLANDALDLNVYNANMGWMNQGQQNQLNALDRLLGWNQQYGIGNSTNVQNTPLNYWQQFSQAAQGLGGMGGTGTNYLQGNPWLGALGGYQLGKSLWGG